MKKIFLIVLSMFLSSLVLGQVSSRWKPLFEGSDIKWDTQSAQKTDGETVRFWYEMPLIDEQRVYFVKNKLYTQAEVDSLLYMRYGVVAKCKSMQYAFFSVSEYNNRGALIKPGTNWSQKELEFNSIGPDTIIENVSKAVCNKFRIK